MEYESNCKPNLITGTQPGFIRRFGARWGFPLLLLLGGVLQAQTPVLTPSERLEQLGQQITNAQNVDQALNDLQQLIAHNPALPESDVAHGLLVKAYIKQLDRQGATAKVQWMLQHFPGRDSTATALLDISVFLADKCSDHKAAWPYLSKAMADYRHCANIAAVRLVAADAKLNHDLPLCISLYRESVISDQLSVQRRIKAQKDLGLTLLAAGDAAAARQAFVAAVQMATQHQLQAEDAARFIRGLDQPRSWEYGHLQYQLCLLYDLRLEDKFKGHLCYQRICLLWNSGAYRALLADKNVPRERKAACCLQVTCAKIACSELASARELARQSAVQFADVVSGNNHYGTIFTHLSAKCDGYLGDPEGALDKLAMLLEKDPGYDHGPYVLQDVARLNRGLAAHQEADFALSALTSLYGYHQLSFLVNPQANAQAQ